MLRLLRNLLCGLSLLLFLILAIAWPLAHAKPFGIWHKRTKTNLSAEFINTSDYYFLTIEGNQLVLGHWRDPRLVYQIQQSRFSNGPDPVQLSALLAQLAATRPGVIITLPNPLPLPPPIHTTFQGPDRFFLRDGFHTGANPRYPWPADPPHTWSRAGISFQRELAGQVLVHRLALPLWLLLLLLAAPPFLLFRSIYRKYRRRRDKRCLHCGYDLRATPTLCPECGFVPATAKSAVIM